VNQFQIVAAAIVGVIATARLTRLLVFDSYPPVAWIRAKWHDITKDGSWAALVDCPYCAAPYFAALVLAFGELTDYGKVWWIVCGWLAGSYVAAVFIAHDGDE
jgi:hypothetical protein